MCEMSKPGLVPGEYFYCDICNVDCTASRWRASIATSLATAFDGSLPARAIRSQHHLSRFTTAASDAAAVAAARARAIFVTWTRDLAPDACATECTRTTPTTT